jgi:hypothetical protein
MSSLYAQPTDNFSIYTNADMKFTIQHPIDWQVEEGAESPQDSVGFNTDEPTGPRFVVTLRNVEPYLDTDTMSLQNTSLQQEVQQTINVLSSLPGTNFKLIRQNEVTVSGLSGLKIEYTAGVIYSLQISTIANGKLYTLTYSDRQLNVPESLPLVNKMVETFQIVN